MGATPIGRALIVDDESDQCELMKLALGRHGVDTVALTSPLEACDRIAREHFDVVLADLGMDEMSGLELAERLIGVRPDLLVLIVTGQGSSEKLVAALRLGAFDFIVKPVDGNLLGLSVARAIKHRRLQDELKQLRKAPASAGGRPLIGESAAMRLVRDLIERLRGSAASVLIHGEPGTGKEHVARTLHATGAQPQGEFISVNCASLPRVLIENALFDRASDTLFLDEIDGLPLDVQGKLLRALGNRKVRPDGAAADVLFDPRVIAATCCDLESSDFLAGLLQRINAVSIQLPPLRERGGDVLLLARHFLEEQGLELGRPGLTLGPDVIAELSAYHWPGNVRQLQSAMAHLAAVAPLDEITVADLPEEIRANRSELFVIAAGDANEILPLRQVERQYVQRVLRLVDGNKTRAAQLLGLDRRTLRRKLDAGKQPD